MSNDISNPHDNFFRGAFALPEVSTPFSQRYLLPGVLAELDLASLQLEKDSFIDERLRRMRHGTVHVLRLDIADEYRVAMDARVALEPGRYLVADAGALLRQMGTGIALLRWSFCSGRVRGVPWLVPGAG